MVNKRAGQKQGDRRHELLWTGKGERVQKTRVGRPRTRGGDQRPYKEAARRAENPISLQRGTLGRGNRPSSNRILRQKGTRNGPKAATVGKSCPKLKKAGAETQERSKASNLEQTPTLPVAFFPQLHGWKSRKTKKPGGKDPGVLDRQEAFLS